MKQNPKACRKASRSSIERLVFEVLAVAQAPVIDTIAEHFAGVRGCDAKGQLTPFGADFTLELARDEGGPFVIHFQSDETSLSIRLVDERDAGSDTGSDEGQPEADRAPEDQ
ncbi:MAG: hypothetical protein D6724_08805 [Armatimonadetes bacterium]|nr:MAG: hypothetical protein D6724_08805 [Armatimonadota bacterium]